jgi:predicted membrane channel-forming protein YqfA (hemolysin III family)
MLVLDEGPTYHPFNYTRLMKTVFVVVLVGGVIVVVVNVTWVAVPKTVTVLNKVVLVTMVWVATGTGVESKHEQALLTREGAAIPVAPFLVR